MNLRLVYHDQKNATVYATGIGIVRNLSIFVNDSDVNPVWLMLMRI